MDSLKNVVLEFIDFMLGLVWGPGTLCLLMGIGLYLTIRLGFIQFTKIKWWMSETVGSLFNRKKTKKEGGISPFEALSTALASSVGVGNIAGVSTAIVLGGPGAVFWMWISALLGMATKFSEIVLSVYYREQDENGEYRGGPMYYIKNGLKSETLAKLFAVFCVLATFGIGNMSQSNTAATALYEAFNIPLFISGVVLATLAAIVIVGGIKRIAKVTSYLVPFMGIIYVACTLYIIIMNINLVPAAFSLIFKEAFNMSAVAGGGAGHVMLMAIRYGTSRGVFSNEAGLGSAPIAHAAADTDHPVKQGMWGIFEVFVDTILICTATAIVVLMSGLFLPEAGLTSINLSMAAFNKFLPGNIGGNFIAISIILFVFSTFLGWSYYGEKAIEFLTGGRFIKLYRIVFIIVIFIGAVSSLSVVWDISEIFNGLMAFPNLIALIFLSGVVIKTVKEYVKENTK